MQESYKNADGVKLGHWVSQQRCENSKGTLSNERLEKLNRVNFVWDVKADRWKKNCEKIKEYYWEFGTLKIPTTLENEYGENVYQWF